MGGRERRDQLPLARVERVAVSVLPQPEGRDAGADGLAERQPHAPFVRRRVDGYVPRHDHNALAQLLPRFEWCRRAQRNGCRVRLEVRVGPVAVILGLPEVTLELERKATASHEIDLEPVEGRKERLIGAVIERLGADQVGECALELTVGSSRAKPRPGRLAPRMVYAEPDAVVQTHALRAAVEDDLHPAVHVADDRAMPTEVDVAPGVTGVELDSERTVFFGHAELGDLCRHGVPVDVADRARTRAARARCPRYGDNASRRRRAGRSPDRRAELASASAARRSREAVEGDRR